MRVCRSVVLFAPTLATSRAGRRDGGPGRRGGSVRLVVAAHQRGCRGDGAARAPPARRGRRAAAAHRAVAGREGRRGGHRVADVLAGRRARGRRAAGGGRPGAPSPGLGPPPAPPALPRRLRRLPLPPPHRRQPTHLRLPLGARHPAEAELPAPPPEPVHRAPAPPAALGGLVRRRGARRAPPGAAAARGPAAPGGVLLQPAAGPPARAVPPPDVRLRGVGLGAGSRGQGRRRGIGRRRAVLAQVRAEGAPLEAVGEDRAVDRRGEADAGDLPAQGCGGRAGAAGGGEGGDAVGSRGRQTVPGPTAPLHPQRPPRRRLPPPPALRDPRDLLGRPHLDRLPLGRRPLGDHRGGRDIPAGFGGERRAVQGRARGVMCRGVGGRNRRRARAARRIPDRSYARRGHIVSTVRKMPRPRSTVHRPTPRVKRVMSKPRMTPPVIGNPNILAPAFSASPVDHSSTASCAASCLRSAQSAGSGSAAMRAASARISPRASA